MRSDQLPFLFNTRYMVFLLLMEIMTSSFGFAQSIRDPYVANGYTQLCPRSSFVVFFSRTGTYGSGNVFTVQLSDSTGSFSSPTTIGSKVSTNATNVSCSLPSVPYGTAYKIRVLTSNPSGQSTLSLNWNEPVYSIQQAVLDADFPADIRKGAVFPVSVTCGCPGLLTPVFNIVLSDTDGAFNGNAKTVSVVDDSYVPGNDVNVVLPFDIPEGIHYKLRAETNNTTDYVSDVSDNYAVVPLCSLTPDVVIPANTELVDEFEYHFTGVVLCEGNLTLNGGNYFIDPGAVLLMTPTPALSSASIASSSFFQISSGQPNTRLHITGDATLVMDGGAITSADCEALWGGIDVDEDASVNTGALPLESEVSYGMYGFNIDTYSSTTSSVDIEKCHLFNNYFFGVRAATRASSFEFAANRIDGDPFSMRYPYAIDLAGGYFPLYGFVNAGQNVYLKSDNVFSNLLRGIGIDGDYAVSPSPLLTINTNYFYNCFEAAISYQYVDVQNCIIGIPSSRPSGWPQMLEASGGYSESVPEVQLGSGLFYENTLGVLCFGGSFSGSTIACTTKVTNTVGAKVLYANTLDVNDCNFQNLDKALWLQGATAIISGPESAIKNSVFADNNTSIYAEGPQKIKQSDFKCNTFSLSTSNSLARVLIHATTSSSQKLNSSHTLGNSEVPCANKFYGYSDPQFLMDVENLTYYKIRWGASPSQVPSTDEDIETNSGVVDVQLSSSAANFSPTGGSAYCSNDLGSGAHARGSFEPASLTQVGSIRAFPNPARNMVEFSGLEGVSLVEFSDLKGVTLMKRYTDSRRIDVSALPMGIYYWNVVDATGHKANGKIVIDK